MKTEFSLLNPQLEVFLAVAKNKSMHGAAKAIHLSQTAITKRIKALENRLKTTLFIRTRHGVQLTPDGDALLRYCYATQELEGETLASMRNAGTEITARINITGPSSIMNTRIIPQCLKVIKNFPRLFVNFEINDCEQIIRSLQNGAHHLAIIAPQFIMKEMQIKKLKDEKYVLVCTRDWKNRSLHDILKTEKIIDFDESDQMSFNYLKKYKLFDMAQKERHFVNRTCSLLKMLTQGYGYGVLTYELAKNYIDNHQLINLNSGKVYKNLLNLAWYARPEPSKYFSDIIQAIK
jgi:DNA-binding transcriptional LysR family regulator